MDQFTRLVRPGQSQIQIDATPKDLPSDGFNWPAFRLVNKQGRVKISPEQFNPESSNSYRLFAVANSRGWFVAVARQSGGSFALVSSPLDGLRAALKSAKDGSEETFIPKRTVSLESGNPNIIAFASSDTRLFVGFEQGQLAVYDTATLFSPGSDNLVPLHINADQSGPIRQVLPNPGAEAGLSDVIAVVRSNGSVVLFNTKLEIQGGWTAGDPGSIPVAAAWSPKGKHIAIGLQTGDILTYPLNNKTASHKQVPPTALPPLVSLTWLAPGHTFKTTYGSDSSQHIITVDSKSPTATYVAPNHPFPLSDRSQQAFTVVLPKWDEDASSSASKSLVVVGDKSSTDLEILGNVDTQWYQQSQENPISLPLDKNTDDTMLLALDLDLTDTSSSAPVLYAFLNDGTLQSWILDHTKPYPGMVTPESAAPQATTAPAAALGPTSFGQASGFATFGAKPGSTFGQPTTTAFGTTGFGQQSASVPESTAPQATTAPAAATAPLGPTSFGQAPGFAAFGANPRSTFGQPTTPAFGTTGFGQQPASVFGQTSQPGGFGQTTPSAFGTTSGLGGLSLGDGGGGDSTQDSSKPKAGMFGSAAPPPSSTTPTSSTFGGATIKPATGFGAFNNFTRAPTTETKASTDAGTASGATSKPASSFGQSSFGNPSFGQTGFSKPATTTTPGATGGGFGSFASANPATFGSATTPSPSGSAFAAAAKTPAPTPGGFAGFANNTPSAFGNATGTAFGATSSPPAFGSFAAPASSEPSKSPLAPAATTSTFPPSAGTSPFAQAGASPFAKREETTTPKKGPSPSPSPTSTPRPGTATMDSDSESPPRPAFKVPTTTTPTTSPFGVSTTPTTASSGGAFGSIQTSPFVFKPASGFGAFGSDKPPASSPFFKAAGGEPKTPPANVFGTSSFTTTTPTVTPPSGPAATMPTFGSSSTLGGFKSSFGTLASPAPVAPAKAPVSGGFSAFSGSSTGFNAFAGQNKSFGELLETGDKDKAATGSTKPEGFALEEKRDEEKPKEDDKKAEAAKATVSAFAPIGKAPVSAFSTAPVFTPPKKEKEKTDDEQVKDNVDETTTVSKAKTASDESFGNLSSSTMSSFAEVEQEPVSEDEGPSGSEDAEGEAQRDLDDEYIYEEESGEEGSYDSSSDLSDVPEEGEQSEEASEEEEPSDLSSPPEPVNIPLPPSRSRSATPQLEVPKIQITPSPSPSPSSPSLEETSTRAKSTTPPGSPENEASPFPSKSSPTPPPTAPSPPSFGLGRPSTRPTRSSPLASAPVSLEEEDDEVDKTAVPLPVPILKPEPVTLPLKQEEEGESSMKPPRSKTPPLLSTLSSQSPPVPPTPILKPAPSPALTPASPAPFSLFGKSKPSTPETPGVATMSPLSIFGDPSKPAISVFSAPAASDKPSAPPSLGMFGAPSMTTPTSFGTFNTAGKPAEKSGFGGFGLQDKPAPGAFSLAGKPAEKSASAPASLFPSAASTPKPASGGPPVFGAPWTPAPKPPSATVPASAPFGLGPFTLGDGKAPEKPTKSPSFFGHPMAPPPTAPQTLTSKQPDGGSSLGPSLPKPPPEAMLEEGMQKECARLVFILTQDLANLAQLTEASKKRMEVTKSLGGSRHRADLGNNEKWALEDVAQYGQVLLQFEKELVELREKRDDQKQLLKEIQSNMLKAGTRKEEIARFNKAKTDKEFAKMLKSRTLGPEHLETQTQLRRSIRTIRDRITKLEDNLKACKKRLNERKSGRPSIKAPSLDTVNRTYRNIDLAIQQQSDEVAQLSSRFTKLKLAGPLKASPTGKGRDPRLPDPTPRPSNVTKHVASTTAAALNAEHSAHRLKRALLSARQEPLLNTKARLAPPAPVAFLTPQKAAPPDPKPFRLASNPLFSTPLTPTTPDQGSPLSNWTLPPDNFNPATPPPATKRGATAGAKRHSPGIPLKPHAPGQSAFQPPVQQAPAPATPASFNWGPLPTFKTAQTSMVAAVKITPPKPAGAGNPPGFVSFAGFGR